MLNFDPLASEVGSLVWDTPANFNGFRVLAALLHGTLVVGVSQLCGVEQRAPPILDRAAITLGIGPHSSYCIFHPGTDFPGKKTRNSPGDEIANVNFFTTTSSTTFTPCASEATEFGEITQNKGHCAVQGHRCRYHSKAHI